MPDQENGNGPHAAGPGLGGWKQLAIAALRSEGGGEHAPVIGL
jgi:hypothetical protein